MSVNRTWQRLRSIRLRGDWKPGGYNVIMLIAQVVVLWTAAQRGMDYLTTPDPTTDPAVAPVLVGIEASIPLTWLGLSFLIPAGMAFVGLATGWARIVSLGHLLTGAAYLVLGITFLRDAPVHDWLPAAAGTGLLLMAAALLVSDSRHLPDVLSIPLGIAALIAGGWLAASGLGYGYRTGNSLLGIAVLNFVFGFGTQVMARREARLRREEEEDLRELGAVSSSGRDPR